MTGPPGGPFTRVFWARSVELESFGPEDRAQKTQPRGGGPKRLEWTGSGGGVAAVDHQGGAGGPAGGLAGEVGVGAGEVVGRAEAQGVPGGDGVEGVVGEAVVDRRAE